ncbi:MAG: hypothetical protein ACK5IQ_11585 [Bacteroidales bacterium]
MRRIVSLLAVPFFLASIIACEKKQPDTPASEQNPSAPQEQSQGTTDTYGTSGDDPTVVRWVQVTDRADKAALAYLNNPSPANRDAYKKALQESIDYLSRNYQEAGMSEMFKDKAIKRYKGLLNSLDY